MTFSPADIETLKRAKAEGKTKEQALAMLAKSRQGGAVEAAPAKPGVLSEQGFLGKAARKVTNFLGGGAVADTYGAEIAKLGATPEEKAIISSQQPTFKQTAGSGLMLGSSLIGGGGAGASVAKATAGQVAKNLGKGAAIGAGSAYVYDIGQNLTEGKEGGEVLQPSANVLLGGTLGPLGIGGRKSGEAAVDGAKAAGKFVSNSPVVRGAFQLGNEVAERVPRFVSRKSVEIRDAASRAERIANSPAPIGNAIKAGVDERVINTIEQADEPTKAGYRDIIKLAEESISTKGTIKQKARPEIIAGDAAAKQYKLIDDQRRKVGKAIGDAVDSLSTTTAVPMKNSYEALDDALRTLDIDISYNESGAVLDFSKASISKAQRAKVKELYELATEGGDSLTPKQIHAKDRLFSQLSREARMSEVGDVRVPAEGGDVSLFQVFRDVYSQTLEEIAPEIKPLNKQYRNLVTFTDDIENSIIKGGKFETNSAVDPAEFAQTNLRRLFSEAQSAADYRAIAEEMDAASRALGYAGATPSDLAQFAYEIRKIYPEVTPQTGFTGSIRTSLADIAGQVLGAGKPNLTDQQKALRELIESFGSQLQ